MTSPRTRAIDRALKAAELEARLASAAREDDLRFVEFAFGSEKTGAPLVIEQGHQDLVDFVNKHQRVVVMAGPGLGKTTIITYGRTLRRIGHDPLRYRAKIWSKKLENATRHTLKIRNAVQFNRRVQMCFPELAPGPKWTDAEWTVKRPPEGPGVIHPKEPTVWAVGLEPSNQGFRSLEDIYDDAIDPTLSQSRYQCERLAELVMDNTSRVEQDGSGKWIWLQNTNRRWDTGFVLAEKYGWELFYMPVIDEHDRTLYPVIWSQKACDDYPPARKDTDLRCRPRQEGDSCFQEAWIHKCMLLGEGKTTLARVNPTTPEVFCITGVDPAGGKKKKHSDLTALLTLMVGPAYHWGLTDLGNNARVAQIVSVVAGKFSGPEIRAQIISHHERYNSLIMVEDVATQDWMRQELAVDAPHVPIAPFPTRAATKHHRDLGFESLATRLSLGLIIIPSMRDDRSGVLRCEPEVERLLEELRNYDPDAHTGDRAMALWIADVSARVMRLGAQIADSLDLGPGPGADKSAPVPSAFSPLHQHLRELGLASSPQRPTSQSEIDEQVRRRFGF